MVKDAYLLLYTVSDLRDLFNELHPVCAIWYNIGLELRIPHTKLDYFKQKHSDPSDSLREMLKHWLDSAVDPHPTWEAVVNVLRSRIVDKKKLAEQLESKYITSVQCTREESNKMERSEGISILPHCFILHGSPKLLGQTEYKRKMERSEGISILPHCFILVPRSS